MNQRDARTGEIDGLLTFVDTHCHLDFEDFESDLPEVLACSRKAGVTRWINVGFSLDGWNASVEIAARNPGMSCMLGVHPGLADVWDEPMAQQLRDVIRQHEPVAVGEIGLDFYRGETNVEAQMRAFDQQLDIACEAGIPVAIHMRNAEPLVLKMLRNRQALPTLLFHSFDGSAALTDWIVESGSYIGVGGLATRSKSTALQAQLKRIPIQHMVLETDAPYLVPNGFKHRRNTPQSIPVIAAFLARLLDTDVAAISRQTTRNAEHLFERL